MTGFSNSNSNSIGFTVIQNEIILPPVSSETRSKERLFVCETCGSDFTSNTKLQRHYQVHSTIVRL